MCNFFFSKLKGDSVTLCSHWREGILMDPNNKGTWSWGGQRMHGGEKGSILAVVKHLQELSHGRKGVAHGLHGYLEMKLCGLLSGIVQASCWVISLSTLRLRLGSIWGQQSGSLFRRASALQNSPTASYASAICSISPLTPVTPTLRAPRVLAGGGPVGPAVLLIWEGIRRARQ